MTIAKFLIPKGVDRMMRFCCLVFALGSCLPLLAELPEKKYEEALAPGGHLDLRGPAFVLPDDGGSWAIPSGYIRRLYDSLGMPEAGSTEFREPLPCIGKAPVTGFKNLSPYAVKRTLTQHGLPIRWERWTLCFDRRIRFKWTARALNPFGGLPVPLDGEQGILRGSLNLLQPGDSAQLPFAFTEGYVALHRGHSGLRVTDIRSVMEGRATSPSPDLIHCEIAHRPTGKPTSVVKIESIQDDETQLLRLERKGITAPRFQLSELKDQAPWFYEYLPDYVEERLEWFDKNNATSITILAENERDPHMVEIRGVFQFDGAKPGDNFDDYFPPEIFHRTHIRDHVHELSLIRPCRKSDILIVHHGVRETGIRFMVDPRYDPQPELRNKLLHFDNPTTQPSRVTPSKEP